MPLLRHVLGAANDKAHALLRAKCLECISLVGMAVGRDTFREDAHAVMQFMQSLQVPSYPRPSLLSLSVCQLQGLSQVQKLPVSSCSVAGTAQADP